MTRLNSIPVQLHLWPWSVGVPDESVDITAGEVEFTFRGSPVLSISSHAKLFLPQRHEQFLPLGPAFTVNGVEHRLYEAPHGVMAAPDREGQSRQGEIQLYTGGTHETVALTCQGARGPHGSDLESKVRAWSQFFDDLVEEAKEDGRNDGSLPWEEVHSRLHNRPEETEPRMALIVKIAEQMRSKVAEVVHALRRVLVRERHLVPAARVAETDAYCLRWLMRQPGENLVQKAASRQHRLLGVLRRESCDTHENRILKDFLARCRQECARYHRVEVEPYPVFKEARNTKEIKIYSRLCAELLQGSELENVAAAPPSPRPNYVLQNDPRYREVWRQYLRLLRQEDERDRLWDWQTRTWSDVARLLIGAALVGLANRPTPLPGEIRLHQQQRSRLRVLREQRLGARVEGGSEPGPFLVFREGTEPSCGAVIDAVHPMLAHKHPVTNDLGQVGGSLYLVVSPLDGRAPSVTIVWAVHTAGSVDAPDWRRLCDSARQALLKHQAVLSFLRRRNLPTLYGMIVASDIDAETADLHNDSNLDNEGHQVWLVQTPMDNRSWPVAMEGLEMIVEEVLEAVL